MVQVFGSGGIRSFVELKKSVHPEVDSFLNQFSINFLSYLVESIGIRYLGEGIFLHFICDALVIQL